VESVAFICKLQKSSREEERRSESPSVPLSLVVTAEGGNVAGGLCCRVGGRTLAPLAFCFSPEQFPIRARHNSRRVR